jgi:ribonucleoside-diphosphate reductase alpha chain
MTLVANSLSSIPVRFIKRNGVVVDWDSSKITNAVILACEAAGYHGAQELGDEVAAIVSQRVSSLEQGLVHLNTVQDFVVEALMTLAVARKGLLFSVATRYVTYKGQRDAERQPTLVDPDQQTVGILIEKENGESEFWNGEDLRARMDFALTGLDLDMSREEIEVALRRSLFDGMKVADLQKTIELNAKALLEKDADFAKFAARLFLTYVYEEVLDWNILTDGISGLRAAHQMAFHRYLRRGIELERINPVMVEKYDLSKLAAAIDPASDMDFDYLGIRTLYDRYLIVDKSGKKHRRLEVPQFFWMRVSMGLFLREEVEPEERVTELYNLYRNRRFCSSTPTLFNSGTLHSQLSSCYLYKVDDSIESIMQRGIAENAYLSKWAGGLGGSWTGVRGTGAYIKGTNGESQGVIPFLKMHNDGLVAVNQGGKRRGSGCAYLEIWHNDFEDFLELRKNTGDDRRRCHDLNTAAWVPDLFMQRMEARQGWTFFRSNEVPDLHEKYGKEFEKAYLEYEAKAARGEIFGREMPALELWKKMLKMLFETGHPWITFKDPCNVRSPQDHAGVIHSSNLCTEITLNTSKDETAVCNLGSVVLENHLKADGSLDLEKLRETVRVAVRALDNVIDLNFYPTEAARTSNMRHRPIGLGMMGLQNALFRKGLPFASEGAIAFNDEAMEAIAYFAYEVSSDLAKEKEPYSTFKGSKWDRGLLPFDTIALLESERGEAIEVDRTTRLDWDALRSKIQDQGMRNSNVLAIAPTATISNIMGSSPCIEPIYKNLFVKSNLSGEFVVLNGFLVKELKARGLWNVEMSMRLKAADGDLSQISNLPTDIRELFKTSFEIPFEAVIDAGARRQKWIDQAQSLNLFLASPDLKTLSHMYRRAWRTGLKTTYYLRTLGASSIEKSTVDVKALEKEKGRPTSEEVQACSLEAMMNGGICESCQ